MPRMIQVVICGLALLPSAGCSVEEIASFGAEAGTESKPLVYPIPDAPKLGGLEDRAGRPLVSTILLGGLQSQSADPLGMPTVDLRSSYSLTDDPSQWSKWAAFFEPVLPFLDGSDAVCGDQLLSGSEAVAGRYSGLAKVLADDRIYMNTAATNCGKYMDVEEKQILADRAAVAAEATSSGTTPTTTTPAGPTPVDCGGRPIMLDSTDLTFSLLIGGRTSSVSDGVGLYPASRASNDDFPFLAPVP